MVTNSIPVEDERLKILRMVEEGKISATEGVALLNALTGEHKPAASQPPRPPVVEAPRAAPAVEVAAEPRPAGSAPRWFKVRVTDLNTGRAKTSVTLPLGLVDWGLRIGARYAPEQEFDIQQVGEMLRAGIEGKLVDVVDEEDGEHVEIFVE